MTKNKGNKLYASQVVTVAELPPARQNRARVGHPGISGTETGERKRVARKAGGKLALLLNLWGPGTKSGRFWWVS